MKMEGEENQSIGCKELFCNIKNGSIFFCRKNQRTIFDQTGPGVPLYFIFLKTLMMFLLVSSIISIYLMYINKRGRIPKNHKS